LGKKSGQGGERSIQGVRAKRGSKNEHFELGSDPGPIMRGPLTSLADWPRGWLSHPLGDEFYGPYTPWEFGYLRYDPAD
jgi:hypothetical protein